MFEDTLIVDADSHWCEPPDLFTKMAPPEYRDRMLHVEEIDGDQMWVFDGHPVSRFSAGGVIGRDGAKESAHRALNEWPHEMIHVGAYDPKVRLEVMDECGIDAQVIFPSTIGLGGQDLGMVEDQHVALAARGEVIGNARAHHPAADHGHRCPPHAVKTCSGCLKLLNSSALPLGSRRNIVACSPGLPGYRTRGSKMNGSEAARIRSATA